MNFSNQMVILKYQIWKFTIRFSKMRAKKKRKQREKLETTLKLLKKNPFYCGKSVSLL